MPETKDWTWVLHRQCPDCGAHVGALTLEQIPAALRAQLEVWPVVLRRTDVAERPAPQTWSTLEYAAHVRDVIEVFDARLTAMQTEDAPTFEDFDPDQAAREGSYQELDPTDVAAAVMTTGTALAARIERTDPEQAGRSGRRGDGAEFTITTLMQYLLHDLVHHAWDVTDGRPSTGEFGTGAEEHESAEVAEPPLQAFAHRHRRVLGLIVAVVALALAVAYVVIAPPQSDAGPLQAGIVRWSVPGCWALIAAAGACWAFDVAEKVRNAFAYAALACWIVYLAARLL
ncbi:hypothetical protein IM660_12985 [Ruania alkalisoli]|uniref:DinB-like domain-containing protein n=1 Tax=Ruania alkalisoli TaxID=2779775 RepID=A0A7M1SPX5_9MICO|nr:DinB family protein [Ruania alkalisoli]QOR69590.1 hypothetical protein IM660_12985 [Ruania alkalisoli]